MIETQIELLLILQLVVLFNLAIASWLLYHSAVAMRLMSIEKESLDRKMSIVNTMVKDLSKRNGVHQ
jgi:hypothetical protein